MADDGNVKVFCRVRPPNEREGGATAFAKTCVTVPTSDPMQQTVLLQLKGTPAHVAPKMFTFDRVFHEHSSQNEVFEIVGVPITKACLEGYNGTIFAYGQTGSGKTFTMQGPDDVIDTEARSLSDRELGLRGLVPRVFDYLFQDANGAMRAPVNGAVRVEHTFACSFMEIYNERVYDLLDLGSARDAAGLILRESGRKGVSVEGLIESVVTNAKQAAELMAIGARNRRVGQTAMNRESSRSHSVFVLQIQSKETTADGLTRTRMSRFNLVDLAGSERQRNTEAAGERLKEAGSINKSLSALGNVIMGLVEQSAGKNRHVHYRDSKLTFLLKDSLGGNSKTFMIATVSPAEDSSHETLSTLKFAARAKLIRNNAVINEDTLGNVIAMQEEIVRLRRQLQESRGNGSYMVAEARLVDSVESRLMGTDNNVLMDGTSTQVSERLLQLEDALAYSLEQNDDLKRSNGQLSMRSSHLHALCTDMKKSIAHMKLLQRLRGKNGGHDEAATEYVPSADAIEWRMKYEDLEEAFVELQDRLRDGRAFRNVDDHDGEIQKLNLMYFTLSKQLAHVIRDKHDLRGRLEADSTGDRGNSEGVVNHEAQLTAQAIEFESRLNAVHALNAAAEEKAHLASCELLHSKQKEAAWKIEQQQSEIVVAELQARLKQMEVEAIDARERIHEEKRRQIEFEMAMQQEAVNAQQEFEHRLAEKMTESFELKQRCAQLTQSLLETSTERDNLKRELSDSSKQLDDKTSELKSTSAVLKSRSEEVEKLTAAYAELERAQGVVRRELQEKVVKLESSNTELKETKTSLLAERDATKAELQETVQQAEDLRRVESSLQEKIREFERVVSNLEMEREKSAELLHITEEALRECKTELDERTESFESAIREGKREFDDLAARLATTVAEHKELIAKQHADHNHELAILRGDFDAQAKESAAQVAKLGDQLREEGARLERTTQEHEAALHALRRTLEETEARLAAEKEQHAVDNERAEQEVVRMTQTHEDAVVSIKDAAAKQQREDEAKIEQLKEALESARTTIGKRDAAIVELGTKIAKVQQDLIRAELKIEEYINTIGTLQDAEATLKSTVEELEKKLASEVHENVAAQTRASQLDVELESQVQLVRQHEVAIAAGQELAQKLQDQIEQLVCERDTLVKDVEDSRQLFNQTVSTHEETTANLHAAHGAEVERITGEARSAISGLESTIAAMTADVEAKLVEIKSLKREIEELLSVVSRLESSLSSEKTAKETVIGELENANAELEDRARRLVEKNECLDRANQQIEEIEEQAKEDTVRLSGRIQLLEADLKDLSRAHDVLTSAHDSLVKEHENALVEKCELEKSNTSTVQHAAELSRRLEASLDRVTSLSSTAKELESKLTLQTEESTTWKQLKEEADKIVSSLKATVAQREEDIDEKDSVISGMEETIENLEAGTAQALEELSRGKQAEGVLKNELERTQELLQASSAKALQAIERLKATEADFQAAVKEHNTAQEHLQHQLNSVVGELDVANQLTSSQKAQLAEAADRIAKLTDEAAKLASRIESLEATIKNDEVARQTLEATYRDLEASHSSLLSTTAAELNEVKTARDELAKSLQEKTDMLVDKEQQLSRVKGDLETSRAQHQNSEDELLKTKMKLVSTSKKLDEVTLKHKTLATEYAAAEDDLKAKKAAWEAKDKELRGRMTVVGEMEVQVTDESKKVREEKVLVAQRKKEYERIKSEYEQLKPEVTRLEALKIQLTKERERYRREVLSLNKRLEDASKEKDKLVGHDNHRQKIQHHIKVKEENNRLIEEVRKLTGEKIKLEIRIGKLELSLKEKENLVSEQIRLDHPRSPLSSNVTIRTTQPKHQSVPFSATKAEKPANEEGIEDTPSKKRLRSRLE